MVEIIPPPDSQALLPPLFACLPTAFASTKPPPALLPLLSPILSQRLQYSSASNWLESLCWDRSKAESLKDQIENANFEPHPASGEIEVGEVESIKYKRLDEETLRAQLKLADWPFVPVFLWLGGDDASKGWKLAELLPHDNTDETWSESVVEASEKSKAGNVADAGHNIARPSNRGFLEAQPAGGEDDYWAQYDSTPGRTPARQQSVSAAPNGSSSEADYYARYGEVQPALDNHDPDEEMGEMGETTLNGNMLQQNSNRPSEQQRGIQQRVLYPTVEEPESGKSDNKVEIRAPRAESVSSKASVERLEDSAERQSSSEIAIKQHISTTMKSMYRLAKSTGMERDEFDRLVSRELETLSILDKDD